MAQWISKKENISYLETENYFYPYITGKEYLGYFSKDKESKYKLLTEKFGLPLEKIRSGLFQRNEKEISPYRDAFIGQTC